MNWKRTDKYCQTSGYYTVFAFGRGIKDGKAVWRFAANYKLEQAVLGVFENSEAARQCCQDHNKKREAPAVGG